LAGGSDGFRRRRMHRAPLREGRLRHL